MTAKEKAIELFDIYESITEIDYVAKDCSLVSVDEILKEIPYINNSTKECHRRIFWIEVKQEIEKL